jgi:hypothetical protein
LHWNEVVSQIGVAPEQSVFDVQATQTCIALQTGVVPPQSAFERHATHVFETASHFERPALVQSASTVHATQVPAFMPEVMHDGPAELPAQSELVWHGLQTCEAVSQTGVAPLQSELNSQPTHVPVG